MFLLINSLLVSLNGVFHFFILSLFLTPKKKRLQNMLPYCIPLFILTFLKCAATTSLVATLFALCNTITLFCYAVFAFQNPFWEKIGKSALMLALLSTTTEAAFSAFMKYVLHITDLNYYSGTMIFPLLVLNILTITFCTLLMFLLKLIKRIKRKRRFCLIALCAFLQLVAPAFLFIMYSSDISEEYLGFSLIAPVILFVANLFLLLSVMNFEEQYVANTAFLELQTLYKIEEEHYRELEQHSEALAKIRHDFQNQLATIHMLLQNKNYNDAKEMALHMKELLDSVSDSASDST